MSNRTLVLIGALTLTLTAGAQQTSTSRFDGSSWWNYVKVLADDNMEGRETGSDGLRRAEAYTVEQLKKSGLEPAVMIDVINAGSGMNTASRDKFPRSILPRSFDFGFATGLMVKDVRLFLEEAKSLGMSMEVAEAVGRLWEVVIRDMGAESDFTSAIKPIEQAAGVVVGGTKGGHAGK